MELISKLSLLPFSKNKFLSLDADNLKRANAPRSPGSLANTVSAGAVAEGDKTSARKAKIIEMCAVAVIGGALALVDYRAALIVAIAYELIGNSYNLLKHRRQ